MVYRDTCGLCGESYLDENLLTCDRCHREFCYRCGDWRAGLCRRCQAAEEGGPAEKQTASE